jgi:hypothetical protein
MALLSAVSARGGHVQQATIRKLLPAALCGGRLPRRPIGAERFADAQGFLNSFAMRGGELC